MTWQTVDTIPRDGRYVLAGWFGGIFGDGYVPNVVRFGLDNQWYDDYGKTYMEPTHWAPLPEGPR